MVDQFIAQKDCRAESLELVLQINALTPGDLHSAKSFLEFIENNTFKSLPSGKKKDSIPFQRKTTLKWNADGSLSSIDMARILSRLEQTNLTECELSCMWGTPQKKRVNQWIDNAFQQ